MKTIKSKKGFTLVECIVAMAVLAIMSLILTMLLSLTVNARNSNMKTEREIDSQVDKIASNDSESVTTENYSNPISLISGGWSELIPGNGNNGAKAIKKTYGSDDEYNNTQIHVLEYDFSFYDYSKSVPGGATPDPIPDDPVKKVYKVSWTKDMLDGGVKITDNSSATNTPSIAPNPDGTYTVIWEVSFTAKEKSPEKCVKLKLPTGATSVKVSNNNKVNCDVCAITNDLVRFGVTLENGSAGNVSAKIAFTLTENDFNNYVRVPQYFGDSTSKTNTITLNDFVE